MCLPFFQDRHPGLESRPYSDLGRTTLWSLKLAVRHWRGWPDPVIDPIGGYVKPRLFRFVDYITGLSKNVAALLLPLYAQHAV